MTLCITPLTEIFAATVTGLDIRAGIEPDTLTALINAFEQHSVLILPNQPLDDAQQIAFSRHFGPLEHTVRSNPAADSYFARPSNIDINTGEVIPPDVRRMRYPLVFTNPVTSRRSVLIGSHASCILDLAEEQSRALLDELLAMATRPENCHRHEWREHDVVIWDNRAVLHRATHYDGTRYRRLMQRTTVSSGKAAELQAMKDQQ